MLDYLDFWNLCLIFFFCLTHKKNNQVGVDLRQVAHSGMKEDNLMGTDLIEGKKFFVSKEFIPIFIPKALGMIADPCDFFFFVVGLKTKR